MLDKPISTAWELRKLGLRDSLSLSNLCQTDLSIRFILNVGYSIRKFNPIDLQSDYLQDSVTSVLNSLTVITFL